MTTRNPLPLDAAIAIAEQHYRELLSIRTLDQLADGDLGEGAQSQRAEVLADKLYVLLGQIQGALADRVRSNEAPIMSLAPSHAQFLHAELIPNAQIIHKAYFRSSELEAFFNRLLDPEVCWRATNFESMTGVVCIEY